MALTNRRRLLYGLIMAGALLGVVEGFLRLAIPADQWALSWEKEDGLLLYRSRTYVGGPVDSNDRQRWRRGELSTRAGTDSVQHDGDHPWRVQTNSEGLREDREIGTGQLADRTMLALGDSWMFGVSANQGQTLPDQLERRLPARLGVDSVEVINGGIPGANSFHMLRRWHYLRDRLSVDDLILGLPHNAPDPGVPEARRVWYQSVRGMPRGRSQIYRGLRWLLLPLGRPHYPDLLAKGKDGDTQAMTIADLKTIAVDARARGIRVWLTLWPNDMMAAQNTEQDLSTWVAPLASAIDGYAGHGLKARRCWGFEDIWHPSEAGYAAISEVIASLIAGGPSSSLLVQSPPCTQGIGGP
jgi:lysophospholipase L1-like esterase